MGLLPKRTKDVVCLCEGGKVFVASLVFSMYLLVWALEKGHCVMRLRKGALVTISQ